MSNVSGSPIGYRTMVGRRMCAGAPGCESRSIERGVALTEGDDMPEQQHEYENLTRIDYPLVEEDSRVPELTREAIRVEARAGLEAIRDFITRDEFIRVLGELYDHAPEDRDAFVRTVLLDPTALRRRGIEVPDGIKLQRSQFGDHRPTIFCVTKLMSDGVRKVTYTFDNESVPALT